MRNREIPLVDNRRPTPNRPGTGAPAGVGSGKNRRRGVILVLFALILVMIFAFLAFSIDIGYVNMVRTSLQNAADGAAMAGAMDLGGTVADIRASAKAVASQNKADIDAVTLADSDIETGTFDTTTRVFTPTNVAPTPSASLPGSPIGPCSSPRSSAAASTRWKRKPSACSTRATSPSSWTCPAR